MSRNRARAYYRQRAHGRCVRCSDVVAVTNGRPRSQCERHLALDRQRAAAWRSKPGNQDRRKLARLAYEERHASVGLCQDCPRPAAVKRGWRMVRCRECLARHNAMTKRWKAQQRERAA